MGLICFPSTGASVFNFLREYWGISLRYLQNYITLETLLLSIQISYWMIALDQTDRNQSWTPFKEALKICT